MSAWSDSTQNSLPRILSENSGSTFEIGNTVWYHWRLRFSIFLPIRRFFMKQGWKKWTGTLAVIPAGLGLVLALQARGLWLRCYGAVWLLCLVPTVAAAEWLHRYRKGKGDAVSFPWELVPGMVLFLALFIYLFSSATTSSWFYFIKWPLSRDLSSPLKNSWLARFILLAALATPAFLLRTRKVWVITLVVLLFCLFQCMHGFISETGGTALYRDDHPSFMFRLWAFGKTFPRLIYYNPLWNAGNVSPHIMASGTASIGTVLWPLWRLVSVEHVYTPAMAFLFIVIVPAAVAVSVRIVGGSLTATFCGGLLGLGVSRYFFLWTLHFGTVGSSFCLAFIAPICACLYRVLWMDRREIWLGAVLVISALLFLAWPPSAIMSIPVVLGVLAGVRQWSRPKVFFLVICGIVLALLSLPWLTAVLQHGKVKSFVASHTGQMEWTHEIGKGWNRLMMHMREAHPLVLFLGLAGVFALPRRGFRIFFGPIIVGLLLLAGWGEMWMPQLQLSRAGIPLFFVATIPAALWIGHLLENSSARLAPVRSGLVVLLLLGGLNTAEFYMNRAEKYNVLGDEILGLTKWIDENTPEDGRILFAGRTVHGIGGGHVAYLPVMTGREMMACDYYHFSPKRVEYDYPPRAFRKSSADIFEFMELYNVTHIITYHEKWKKHLRKYPERYEEVHEFGNRTKKSIFRVHREPNMFLKGEGRVRSDIDELVVRVDNPDEVSVLKYNWVDGLKVKPPVEIRPHDAGNDIRFIEVHPHGRKEFRIRYREWL